MSGPLPNENVLTGTSLWPPSITGDQMFGTLVAWADQLGQIFVADGSSSPPYQPVLLNSAWSAMATPAVALAVDWGRVYVAWTDPTGAVHLANSGGGWTDDVVAAPAGSSTAGPSLAFGNDSIFVAWRGPQEGAGEISLAAYDVDGNTAGSRALELYGYSSPSVTWQADQLFLSVGGSLFQGADMSMGFWRSTDDGKSWTAVPVQANASLGAPSLAVVDDYYFLAWADGQTATLSLAATSDLTSYDTIAYSDGCHGGAPQIAMTDTLNVAFTMGAAPPDPRNHHVTIGAAALPGPAPQIDPTGLAQRYPRLLQARSPDPCPDPLSVYDPSEDKCVPRMGCWGQCVLSSYTSVWGLMPVFNPIAYAVCVAQCKASA